MHFKRTLIYKAMDFVTVGSILGILSSVIHAGQGVFHLSKHFRLVSTCCNCRSSLEIDLNTPEYHEPDEKQDKTGAPK